MGEFGADSLWRRENRLKIALASRRKKAFFCRMKVTVTANGSGANGSKYAPVPLEFSSPGKAVISLFQSVIGVTRFLVDFRGDGGVE